MQFPYIESNFLQMPMSQMDNSRSFCELDGYYQESKLMIYIENIDLWNVAPGGYGPIGVQLTKDYNGQIIAQNNNASLIYIWDNVFDGI